MKDPLFPLELPLVKTDEELQKVKAAYRGYDSYYIASACIEDRRDRFEQLWRRFEQYSDTHFKSEIRVHFHQRSWEMYVGNVLLDKGLSIGSDNEGPDFVVNGVTYVECIACTRGDDNNLNSVPEPYVAPTIYEILAEAVPTDKIILRITNAITTKTMEYSKWRTKRWFDEKSPFVIAINTADMGCPQRYFGIPIIINALFGLENMVIGPSGRSFIWRTTINKGDSQVPVNYFCNNDFDSVSGVLFSEKMVLDHPDRLGDDCVFVNNPFARNPVDHKFTSLFDYWCAEKDGDGIMITKLQRDTQP
ncbi:MAG: hypothetical protein ACYC0V_05730 [Armatimonadota bacterium]